MDDNELDEGIRASLTRAGLSASETDAAMHYHHAAARAVAVEGYCLAGQTWVGLGGMVVSFFLAQYAWWWWLFVGSIVLVFLGNVCPVLTPVGVWVRRRERRREALVLEALRSHVSSVSDSSGASTSTPRRGAQ